MLRLSAFVASDVLWCLSLLWPAAIVGHPGETYELCTNPQLVATLEQIMLRNLILNIWT